MAYRHFEEFLIRLEQEGELTRVKKEVSDPRKLLSQPSQKAMLFERVEWSDFQAVTNVFGSEKRMAWALGLDHLEELNLRLSRLLDVRLPRSMGTMMARAGEVLSLLAKFNTPRGKLRDIPAQEVIVRDDFDLFRLPGIRSESGKSLFLPCVQIIEGEHRSRLGEVIVTGKDTMHIEALQQNSGAIAVVFGSDPAYVWSLSVPLPEGLDRSLLAGWLRNRPVPFVRAVSIELDVPADAEMVLEGTIVENGVIKVNTITRRKDAICPIFLTWDDRQWMRKASERLFLPLLRLFADEIHDFYTYESRSRDEVVIVSSRRPAEKIFFTMWGAEITKNSRIVIIVDATMDIHDFEAVKAQIQANVDGEHDVLWIQGGGGTRIGIDATRKDQPIKAGVPDAIMERIYLKLE